MGFWKKVKKAFKAVAKIAVVVVAILQPQLIPAIGNAILGSVGVTGASAVVATATGAAAINTAAALVSGASVEEALKAGAVAGVSAGVGGTVGAEFGKVAGSAAGSAAGTIVAGGKAEDVLRNAIAGAAASTVDSYSGSRAVGAATGAAIATKGDLLATASAAAAGAFNDYKSGTGAFSPTETAAAPATTTATEPPRLLAAADTGTVSDTPTPAATAMSEAIAPAPTGQPADFGTVEVTAPRFSTPDLLSSVYTAPTPARTPARSFSAAPAPAPSSSLPPVQDMGEIEIIGQRPTREADPFGQFTSVPEITITGQRSGTEFAAEPTDATEREGSLAKPAPADKGRTYIYRGVSATGGAPRTSALAGALRTEMASPVSTTGLTGYRPAGEIESEESGKQREDVWNEASLRLKDALGL